MKMMYVGADVHQTSTTLVVLDHRGRQMKQAVVRTRPELLVAEVQSLDGPVIFAAEESNHSRWLYECLASVAHRVIICDPKRNKFSDKVNKSDLEDARGLAELAYLGKLKPVYHGNAVHTELKELVKAYDSANWSRTQAMNSIRGVLANDGTWGASGAELFGQEGREAWLGAVRCPGRSLRLRQLFAKYDLHNELKTDAKKRMVSAARKHSGWEPVRSVPGIGDVRAAHILAIIGTPHRFRTVAQWWAYAGLAVVDRSTNEYDENLQRKSKRRTVGLNKNCNKTMKSAFKGAAQSALQNPQLYPEIAEYYLARSAVKGTDIAKVHIARKLAAITFHIWRRTEEYNPDKASWKVSRC